MFRAVQDCPEDDAARLAYADCVQEDGDEELASLIRVGCLCACVRGGRLSGVENCYSCGNKNWVRHCQEPGCREAAMECDLDIGGFNEDQSPEFFCGEHAPKHGYCSACGAFWGGISMFEMRGLCDHCYDELRESDDEEYEDVSDDGDWDDYP